MCGGLKNFISNPRIEVSTLAWSVRSCTKGASPSSSELASHFLSQRKKQKITLEFLNNFANFADMKYGFRNRGSRICQA